MLITRKSLTIALLAASLASLLAGCGERSDSSTAATGKLFDKEISKQACTLLTAADVATVAGVNAADLQQREIGGNCMYSWDGGEASLGLLNVSKTAEAARRRFENSYRNQTGEEVAADLAKVAARIEKSNADGTTDVDPAQTRKVTGALGGFFSGGFQYEEVPGLGDAASFETTRRETEIAGRTYLSYANSLNVLTSNLKFTVSFSRGGEPKPYPDEGAALARSVINNLSR